MMQRALAMNRGELLSLLWVFAMLNYLYADVIGLMDASLLRQYLTGTVDSLEITPGFLLAAAILMEIPIAMIVLSRLLPRASNRWTNLVAGSLKTLVVLLTLFVGTPTAYYVFFAGIEVASTSLIVVLAWTWQHDGQDLPWAPQSQWTRSVPMATSSIQATNPGAAD